MLRADVPLYDRTPGSVMAGAVGRKNQRERPEAGTVKAAAHLLMNNLKV